MDKNGKIVTRHVRSSDSSLPSKPLPMPTVAPREVGLKVLPTNSQQREHSYVFDGGKFAVDADLAAKLSLPSDRPIVVIKGSDQEIYEVLSVTDRATAMALLERGVKSAEDAMEALEAFDRDDLIQDNSAVVNDAFNRMVRSHTYISNNSSEDIERPHYVDYLEALDMISLRDNTDLHESVRDGLIRIEDIKEVTPERISRYGNWKVLKPALMRLADGSANYSAQGLADALDAHKPPIIGHELENTLTFAQRYGSDFAVEMTPINYYVREFSDYLLQNDIEGDRGQSIVNYYARVKKSSKGTGSGIPLSDMILFHDAGVDPDLVAAGQITRVQAEAISSHGIASSVSGGWL